MGSLLAAKIMARRKRRKLEESARLLRDKPKEYLKVAYLLLKANEINEAKNLYQKYLERNNDHLTALYGLTFCAVSQGKDHEARNALLKIVTLSPNELPAITALAEVYEREGSLDLAIELKKKALSLAPSNPEVCYSLGHSFLLRGLYSKAIEAFEQVEKLPASSSLKRFTKWKTGLAKQIEQDGVLTCDISGIRKSTFIIIGLAVLLGIVIGVTYFDLTIIACAIFIIIIVGIALLWSSQKEAFTFIPEERIIYRGRSFLPRLLKKIIKLDTIEKIAFERKTGVMNNPKAKICKVFLVGLSNKHSILECLTSALRADEAKILRVVQLLSQVSNKPFERKFELNITEKASLRAVGIIPAFLERLKVT